MMSLCLWDVLVFSALLSTVSSMDSDVTRILSRVNLFDGPQTFTITCGTQCFEHTADDEGANLDSIRISFEGFRQDGTKYLRTVRDLMITPNQTYSQTSPEGRSWRVHAGDKRWTLNNFYNVYTKVFVNDPTCEDVGYYDCAVTLFLPNGTFYRKSRGQALMFIECPQAEWYQNALQG